MEKLNTCRICLVKNVRMYVVVNKNLHELYEKLTDIPFVTEDSRPILACFICCAQLKKCYKLLKKCMKAEELYTQILNEDYEPKPLINQDNFEFLHGFIKTPIENISTVGKIDSVVVKEELEALGEEPDDILVPREGYPCDDVRQTDSVVVKEELEALCEEADDILVPKEEYPCDDDLETVHQHYNYLDIEYMPPHQSELQSEDNVLLMEIKSEVESEEEVHETKRKTTKTKNLETVHQHNYLEIEYMPPHQPELQSEDDVPLMELKTEVEAEQEVHITKRKTTKTKSHDKNNIMTSRNRADDAEISRLLHETSDEEIQGSDSETEDNLLEDEVQSDAEDYEVSAAPVVNPLDTEDVSENDPETPESASPSMPSCIVMPQRQILRGKNGQRWSATKGRTSGRVSSANIIRTSRGPTRMNKCLYEPLECFNIFITDDIVEEVTKWTNAEIQLKIQRPDVKATFKTTTCEEIRALFGILTLTAAMKDNHLTTDELFDCSYSGNRYVAAMCRDRFDFLIRCLRMDDKSLRPELRATDTFVPIRKIWEIFINHCRSNYIPGPYVTIDEQLLGFRGRCPFRMYIPNKPNKYGIKIVMTCDSATRYMIDAMPYLGKCTQTNGLPLGEFYVKELTKAVHGSNRNITCGNWFISVPLAKNLLRQPYNLTLVGTIRSNKREIPDELKNMQCRRVGTSMFCYDGPLTLVSYKPKPSKMVFVLSSCDEEGTVHPTTGKPNMIHFYNETKGGVDTFDQMCSMMSCSRKTNRWPMAMFYGMLNMAFINAYIIYCDNVLSKKEKPLGRRDFMKKLSISLMTPWLEARQQMLTLPTNIKEKISGILPKRQAEPPTQREGVPEPKKRKYCAFCPSKIRRMTKSMCDSCKNPICGEHKSSACPKCLCDQN